MTLPLRKKLPTTVQSIRFRVKGLKQHTKRALLVAALLASSVHTLSAQSPSGSQTWQPSRLPLAPTMQPLSGQPLSGQRLSGVNSTTSAAVSTQSNQQAANSQAPMPSTRDAAAAGDSGVVLRWRASTRASTPSAPGHAVTQASATSRSTSEVSAAAQHLENDAWSNNPLRASGAAQSVTGQSYNAAAAGTRSIDRGQPAAGHASGRSAVRTAAYQPPAGPPSLPSTGAGASSTDNALGQQEPLTLPPSQAQPIAPDLLNQPEPAPAPTVGNPVLPNGAAPSLPSQAAPSTQLPERDGAPAMPPANESILPGPFDRPRAPDINNSPSDQEGRSGSPYSLDDIRPGPDSSVNCNAMRDLLRHATLDKINLNSSPRFGQGLKADMDEAQKQEAAEKQRLDFAATAEERQWCDRHGRTMVRGRMVDLVNEQVVLDINGTRREIPLRDLCDADMAYVGKSWNLPVSCTLGVESFAGRSFIPSAMQWKASGLCHQPLYFEEVQLERYGHEIGPVLQPLVSTAHFFGNIAILPYKMGIHPPQECQYALGYYRPGNCAPYMVPPIPISLRGAAVQAGAVLGASALVP